MNIMNSEAKAMSSEDLYSVICESRVIAGESRPRYNDFSARLVDELEGEHYESFVVQNPNNTKTTHYLLSIDQCVLVGMRESKAVRKQVLKKLKELNEPATPQIPQTYAEALLEAGRLAQIVDEQSEQLAIAAPKVEVYEALADRKGDVSTTIIAKQLGMTAIKLNRFLRDNGVKWEKADLPKAGYSEWFNVVSDVKNGHEFTQCLVTPLGQIEIAKLFNNAK